MKLPVEFKETIIQLLGAEAEQVFAALNEEPPVSIRLNPLKEPLVAPRFNISALSRVPWADHSYYLPERPSFTFDPLFHAGCYYVQEASSMFLAQALMQYVKQPVTMLDLCAAPGGKSTHARAVLPEHSLLVSNEVIRSRAQILSENLTKWGHPDVIVTNNDPADFARAGVFFDVVLADVPCSGEGMFRKDTAAIGEWSPEHVEMCWQRQRRIIAAVWPALTPGGLLIYSTCTYNIKENETNVHWIAGELGAEVLTVDVPEAWNITGNLAGEDFPVYRFLPHKTRGEGFFLAVLRKTGHESSRQVFNEALLAKRLKVIQPRGVEPGVKKGKDLIPSHASAIAVAAMNTGFARCELSYSQAIAYLRREALLLDSFMPRGYLLVTYRGVPLGFVKNIGNRANNLYPQEWRIRSGYIPLESNVGL